MVTLFKNKKGSANFDPANDFCNKEDFLEVDLQSAPLILVIRGLSEAIIRFLNGGEIGAGKSQYSHKFA